MPVTPPTRLRRLGVDDVVSADTSAAPRWRLRDVAIGYAVAVVAASTGAAIAIGSGADDDGVATFLASQLPFWAVLIATVEVASRRGGTRLDCQGELDLRVERSDWLVGVPTGVVTQLVVLPLVYVPITWVLDDPDVEEPARDLLERGSGLGALAVVVGVIVIAPIVEELFFRGLFLGALRVRLAAPAAVVVSAGVFGLTHFQALQFPGLFVAGLLFATLTVRSGRLGPAVVAHGAFNAATVVTLAATG